MIVYIYIYIVAGNVGGIGEIGMAYREHLFILYITHVSAVQSKVQ